MKHEKSLPCFKSLRVTLRTATKIQILGTTGSQVSSAAVPMSFLPQQQNSDTAAAAAASSRQCTRLPADLLRAARSRVASSRCCSRSTPAASCSLCCRTWRRCCLRSVAASRCSSAALQTHGKTHRPPSHAGQPTDGDGPARRQADTQTWHKSEDKIKTFDLRIGGYYVACLPTGLGVEIQCFWDLERYVGRCHVAAPDRRYVIQNS